MQLIKSIRFRDKIHCLTDAYPTLGRGATMSAPLNLRVTLNLYQHNRHGYTPETVRPS